jgi:hypothetical protein
MPQADALGPRSWGNAEPVKPPEDRCSQPADEPRTYHVVRRDGPLRVVADEIDDVKNDRSAEKPQWEHNEHRMNRMPSELHLAFHK